MRTDSSFNQPVISHRFPSNDDLSAQSRFMPDGGRIQYGDPKPIEPIAVAPAAAAPEKKEQGFFGKVFGAVGRAASGVGKFLAGVLPAAMSIAGTVAGFFGPAGMAVSAALSAGSKVAGSVLDTFNTAMDRLKTVFKF